MVNKFKLTILASMILASSFIMPTFSILAIEQDIDNYVQILENSDIFRDLVSTEGLDEHAVANYLEHNLKEDEAIVLVNGMVKNSDSLGVFAFIDPDTNEVVSLTKMHINEDAEPGDSLMIEYDQNGNIVNEFTLSELESFIKQVNENSEFNDNDFSPMHLPNPIVDPGGPGDWDNDNPVDRDSWWFKFACGFATSFSCRLACPAFINPIAIGACNIACSVLPGSVACRS